MMMNKTPLTFTHLRFQPKDLTCGALSLSKCLIRAVDILGSRVDNGDCQPAPQMSAPSSVPVDALVL